MAGLRIKKQTGSPTPVSFLLDRVCKTFRRLMKDSSLWKCVDLTQYSIKLRDLTKVTRLYLSKSLKHLELKGFLCTTVKTKLLSEVFLEELRARSPNLSKLVIHNAELRTLPSSKLPKSLQHLHLQSCQLREGWLLPALEEGTLKNLRSLDLSGCGRITNRDISPMSQLKNLEELSLLGCYRLGDQALEAITADHPNLKSLLIGHSDFTDVGMKDVALNMKRLERFSIQHCELVTSKSLKFIQRMKTIEELDISYNPQFDDASIYGLVKGLPNLRKITVHDVTTVSDTIMQINPNIEVL